MGGKACFAVCPSDTAIALTALDAELEIKGPQKVRKVCVNEFFTPRGNILEPDELLTHIQIPAPTAGARQVFLKYTLRKPVDFAIASVAAVVTMQAGICKDARIVLGAVAPTPVRAIDSEKFLIGKVASEEVIAEAARAAVKDAKPMRMNAYKVEITRVLVKRALLPILQSGDAKVIRPQLLVNSGHKLYGFNLCSGVRRLGHLSKKLEWPVARMSPAHQAAMLTAFKTDTYPRNLISDFAIFTGSCKPAKKAGK